MRLRWVVLVVASSLLASSAVAAAKLAHTVPKPKPRPAIAAPQLAAPAIPLPIAPPEGRGASRPTQQDRAPRPLRRPDDAALAKVTLPPEELKLYAAALRALDAGDVDGARQIAGSGRAGVAVKLVNWLWLTGRGISARFADYSEFLLQNGDWPSQDLLLRRAESALADSGSDTEVLAWFASHPPLTGDGEVRLAEALLNAGRKAEGLRHLRHAWIEGSFAARTESQILRQFGRYLDTDDHIARLDRLLWDGERAAARRMLRRVPAGQATVAEARLALGEFSGGVDRLIARVPDQLRDDPGLVYDRVRWRRARGLDDLALELLLDPAARRGDPERWWVERHIQARRLVANGNYRQAYRLAAEHGLTSGRNFAEAEWLAGWIALRFLNERAAALNHFGRLFDGVRTPVSRARAAYWAGRAAEAMGSRDKAAGWYREASANPTTYYGQLAAIRLDPSRPLALAADPQPDREQIADFERSELVQAARLLAALGETDSLRSFILRASDQASTPVEHSLVAALAESIGRIDLAVAAAKRSSQNGVTIIGRTFPVVENLGADLGVERALLLALSRQESEFNAEVVSSAGARGLMQLMPATARTMAKRLDIAYRPERLTADPDYNIRLGSQFLASLLDSYDGNYALALAAYNAGDSRVRRWIRDFGDPRSGEVDAIDWVELIPFGETRNYIQRVLEGVQVYRQQLDPGMHLLIQIDHDLRGHGPRPGCDC